MITYAQRLVAVAIAGFALSAGVLPIGAHQDGNATPPATPAPTAVRAADLRVAEQSALAIPGDILAPSPDGRLLAGTSDDDRGTLCVYEVSASDQPSVCLDREAAGITSFDYRSIVWSPDSTRLAFTENFAVTSEASHIWVMDAASGAATNVSGAGDGDVVASPGTDAETLRFDVFPAWSPDGSEIAFGRGVLGADDLDRSLLMRVPSTGGEPVEVFQISTEDALSIAGPPAYTPDGTHLLFTVGHLDRDDPDNGVWVVGRDGSEPRLLAGATDPERGYPVLSAVSPRGDLALATGYLAARFLHRAPLSLIDLATGTSTPLERLDPSLPENAAPFLADFSPDGSKLLLVARGGRNLQERDILVRDVDGTEDFTLLTVPTVGLGAGPGIWWLPGGVVIFDSTVSGEGESDPHVWAVLHLQPTDESGSAGAATPTTTTVGSVDPATVEAGMTLVVNDSVAAVRSAPSTEAAVVAELTQGAEVIALGPAEEGDGFVWIPVRDAATGTIGYVRAELLSPAED